MKKLTTVFLSLILVIISGVYAYNYAKGHGHFPGNESTIQSSNTSAAAASASVLTSAPGITSAIASTKGITTVPQTTREQVTTIPEGWNDNGIFSGYYKEAYKKLSSMSLEEKVGQLILARCPQENAVNSIKNYHLGGFVLFGEDFKNKTASVVISTIKSYQKASEIPMIISVDEEGGKVVRISSNPLLWDKKFLSPQEVYADGGLKAIREDTIDKAKMLKKYGLNVNLAPVADVSLNPADYIYKRTLGKPAAQTGEYVSTVVKAMRDSGLSSTLKHFPGYGSNVNTHTGIAIDKRPYSTFKNSDFIPFEDGIDAGAESVLVSHNIVECMDKGVPASLSPAVHNILRNTLHFTGVIITDDLSMEAIKDYTNNTDPVVKSVLAGNDMLIINEFADGYNSILKAVKNGRISKQLIDRAVFRILAWKYAKGIIN